MESSFAGVVFGGNLRPIHTARNFRYGSDKNGTGTEKM